MAENREKKKKGVFLILLPSPDVRLRTTGEKEGGKRIKKKGNNLSDLLKHLTFFFFQSRGERVGRFSETGVKEKKKNERGGERLFFLLPSRCRRGRKKKR